MVWGSPPTSDTNDGIYNKHVHNENVLLTYVHMYIRIQCVCEGGDKFRQLSHSMYVHSV